MAETETDTTTEREVGSESIKCPTCGSKKLKQVEEADGGVSWETCTNCYGTPKQAEKAAADDVKEAKAVARERGTDTADTEE